MHLRLKFRDPRPNDPVGAQEAAGQKDRIGLADFLGVKLRFLAHQRVGRALEFLMSHQPGFDDPEKAGAQPLEILVEAPLLDLLDLGRTQRRVLDHGREPVGPSVELFGFVFVVVADQIRLFDPVVEGRAGHGTVYKELGQGGFELHQPGQFLGHHGVVLVVEAHDHGGQDRDAVLPELGKNLLHGPALLLGVTGLRPLVTHPKTVDPHFQDLFHGVLADGLDAGKDEDGRQPTAFHHVVTEFQGPGFVEQKILVENNEDQVRVPCSVALHLVENVLAGRKQLHVAALKEVGGAAKVTTVGAPQSGENFRRLGHGHREDFQVAHQVRVAVGFGPFGFAQQPAEKGHALLPANKVAVGLQVVVRQYGAVAAQDDPALGSVLPHQSHRVLHFMEHGHQKGDADVVVALFQLADQLAFRRVLEHHRGGVQVGGDVIQGKMDVQGPGAEDPLGAGDLLVEQFVTDRSGVAFFFPEGTADAG